MKENSHSQFPSKPQAQAKTFVAAVDPAIAGKMEKELLDQGFTLSKPAYTLFSARKKGITCTLYTSGKLVVQGKDSPAFIEFYLEPEILGAFTYTYANLQTEIDLTERIGIDEAGKGDFFGPLCIAGVYAEGDTIASLQKIGVKDSKTMSDKTILQLAQKIRKQCAFHVVKITPAKYNALYPKFRNLNRLLAWGHATAIENLVKETGCSKVIIDQFASEEVVESALAKKNLKIDLTQRHKGEEDLVVAAASILAREAFLLGLESLETQFGMKLPKGASSMVHTAGKAFFRKYGRESLAVVAKQHFKTFEEVINA